ncbi:MAG: fibronectin type III domain-containing protein, partial [Bacteroidales bacterium]|nr:fibronectin type III domain-containing protein [Bacteroidales bacterium]
LTAATPYAWYVQADCGGGSLSPWTGPSTFTTPCVASVAPFLEVFTAAAIPACWSMSGPENWLFSTGAAYGAAAAGDHTTGGGTNYAWVDGSGSGTNTGITLVSPLIDPTGLTTPRFSFWYFSNNTNNPGDNNTLYCEMSIDAGAWTNIFTYTGDNANWLNFTHDLSSYTITSTVQFRFIVDETASTAFYNDILIDDVAVEETPTCFAPSAQIVTNITQTSADLGWTENGSATTWNIEWGPTGFTQGSGTMITGTTTNPHSLTGLTAGTTYDWYVQADCGGGNGQSTWVGPNTFTTSISNDDCSGAISLPVSYSCNVTTATNVGATDSGETPSCANYSGGDVWFSAVVPATGYLVVECFVNGGFTDGGMSAWTGACGTLTEYDCNDDGGEGFMPLIEINDITLAGQTLYFNVWEYGNNNFGPFDICAHTAPSAASWTGTTDNDWHTASNWDVTGVPGPITNVTIPAGLTNYPTLSAAGSCNNLTVQSGASGDASLLADNNLTVNGTSTVQRYVTGGVWHDVSASTQGQTLNSVYFGGTPEVWLTHYNEPTNTRTYLTALTDPMDPGAGFEIWVEAGNNATINYTGALQRADVTLTTASTPPVSYTVGIPQSDYGYNLIGNPFASPIDLDLGTWALTDVSTSFWVWDPAGGTYVDWNTATGVGALTGGVVPMGQGFFMQATGAAPSITIPTGARVHSSQSFYKNDRTEDDPMHMKLRAIVENGYDEMNIAFLEGATNGIDIYDTRKMFAFAGNASQVFSYQVDEDLSINSLPLLTETGRSVKVGFKTGKDGEQILEANLENLPETEVFLEDLFTGEVQSLVDQPQYKFEASVGDEAVRFILHFNPTVTGVDDPAADPEVRVYAFDGAVYIQSKGKAAKETKEIWIYDMYGRTVVQTTAHPSTLNRIPVDRTNAYLIVRTVSESGVATQKVYIN